MGDADGGALAVFFAATHPERVQALILNGAYARAAWAPDYPIGQKEEDYLADREDTARRWGTIEFAQEWVDRQAPSLSTTASTSSGSRRLCGTGPLPRPSWSSKTCGARSTSARCSGACRRRRSSSPSQARAIWSETGDVARERYLAERIPGAKYVELPGRDLMHRAHEPRPAPG